MPCTLASASYYGVIWDPNKAHAKSDTPQVKFATALQMMPEIYLAADAVLHIDGEWTDIEGDGSIVEVRGSADVVGVE